MHLKKAFYEVQIKKDYYLAQEIYGKTQHLANEVASFRSEMLIASNEEDLQKHVVVAVALKRNLIDQRVVHRETQIQSAFQRGSKMKV